MPWEPGYIYIYIYVVAHLFCYFFVQAVHKCSLLSSLPQYQETTGRCQQMCADENEDLVENYEIQLPIID